MDLSGLHQEHTQFLESILFENLGREVAVETYQFLGGGCINTALKVDTDQGIFFIKWNENLEEPLFKCEAQGLAALRKAGEIDIPNVVGYGAKHYRSYLILEYIDSLKPQKNYWSNFGTALAKLHAHTHTQYGFESNNFIGILPQSNEWESSWNKFFIEKRLKVQAGLALYKGLMSNSLFDQFFKLYERLPEIIPATKPALLHGDLWSGNVMVNSKGLVSLIDPAVYYGNREAEIAFTKLFGGFDEDFYQAYEEAAPFEPGFNQRVEIYNLYPLLVHANLFGSGYLSGVERILKKF